MSDKPNLERLPEIQFPDLPTAANPIQSIMADLKLSGQPPGEGAVIAITNAIASGRANMSQENRDRWDALQIRISEDTYRVWRALWERAGVLPKEEKE